MIKLFRVDDKLLHGQIAFSWVKGLKIHTIIIVNDDVVNDPFMKMTLGLSKPYSVNLRIEGMSDSLKLIKEALTSNLNVMVIVKTVEDADLIIKEIPEIKELNLGAIRERYHTKTITENVSLNDDEIQICRKLIENKVLVEARLTYKDPIVNLKDVIYEG